MNTNYVFPSAQVGELRQSLLYASGPASYSQTSGDIVYNPGSGEYINAPSDATTLSGNYKVRFVPSAVGVNQVRAGGGVGGPSVSGWTARWDYAPASPSVNNPVNFSSAGVPLTLGPLSAAATQSTYTAAGLLTVVGANTLTPGQFIVFSNGASSYGILFDGVMAQVVTASATGYTVNFGQGLAGAYTINTDTLKYQVVQVGTGNLLQGQLLTAPITGVLATAVLLTVTQTLTAAQVASLPGQFLALGGGFKAASYYANGAIVQVTSASSTGWTAKWVGTIIGQTSGETGTASLLVTNGGAPVTASQSAFGAITNSLAVASSSTTAGLLSLTSVQNFAAGNILAVQGVGTNTTLNGVIATVIPTSLTNIMIKANGWTLIANTSAETLGTASLLVTGNPPLNDGEVLTGTSLAAEQIQFGAVVSSL
jgi:hypothetical protein